MFEGNTILAGLAARTSTIALGLLVGGVGYRNPAQHAKITTTLDVISGGRAFHGIGAGWFEAEHHAYGYAFPPLKRALRAPRGPPPDRARDVHRGARRRSRAPTTRSPAPTTTRKPLRGDIPILVGGSGERKTLRMVAQYADGCNLFGDLDAARHLLGVLERHCEDVGRDPAEITKTSMMSIAIADTEAGGRRKLDAMRDAGFPPQRIAGTTRGRRSRSASGAGLSRRRGSRA